MSGFLLHCRAANERAPSSALGCRDMLASMTCRLCGAPDPRRFFARGKGYLDCPQCGYVGLEPTLFPRRDDECARYLLHKNDSADIGYRNFLETFVKALPKIAPGARVLDFGSGPVPALSDMLRARGFIVTSYDPFFAPGKAWRRHLFDLIVAHEVAEHLRFPGRSLGALAGRLSIGGWLALRTRFAPDSDEEFVRWWYREDSTHVGFFRARSFVFLAGKLGLELEELSAPDRVVLRKPRKLPGGVTQGEGAACARA